MNVIVHYPTTPEGQADLEHRVAKFHAEYVYRRVSQLPCSTEQKLKLIDAIAETILQNARKEE